GSVVMDASQDMVLGCYYLTYPKFAGDEAKRAYSTTNEAIYAYDSRLIKLQTPIRVPMEGKLIETTVGRILFNEIMPEDFGFRNETTTKKVLQRLVAEIFARYGTDDTAKTIDAIKNLGFTHSTLS